MGVWERAQPAFLDAQLADRSPKSGYRRIFVKGPPQPTRMNPNGIASYCYAAVPLIPRQTGIRSFAADQTGRICFDPEGSNLCTGAALPDDCRSLE